MKTMIWLLAGGLLFALAAAFQTAETPEEVNPEPLCSDQPLFQEFLGEFENVRLPFSIGTAELIKKMESKASPEKTLATKYGEILPVAREARFSRMGRPEIEPMVAFHLGEGRAAVVFATSYPFREWVEITMATFDCNDGKLLEQRMIAHASNNHLQIFSIGEDMVVRTTELSRKDYPEIQEGAAPQTLTAADFETEGTAFFQIKKNGHIEALDYDPATRQAIVP